MLLQQSAVNCFGQTKFNYDLDKPDITHQLPAVLNEISGLTDIDNDHIACVQDELGIVFIYNFRSGEMVSQHRFDSVGDFEGLTYTGKSLYILRSDGRLTEWNDFPTNKSSFIHSRLSLATSNNEGLCYDPGNNRLLIAAKANLRIMMKNQNGLFMVMTYQQRKLRNSLFTVSTWNTSQQVRRYPVLSRKG